MKTARKARPAKKAAARKVARRKPVGRKAAPIITPIPVSPGPAPEVTPSSTPVAGVAPTYGTGFGSSDEEE